MSRIYDDNALSIGNTPLVRLKRMVRSSNASLLAKVEGRNPCYSVKCRIAASMVWDAEKRGVLTPGMTVVEPTSGNTGIGLAYVCASRGYNLTIVMPETMSIERRKVLSMMGATLELTPGEQGMTGAIARAGEIVSADPEMHYMPQQFLNPANPAIHEKTTGPEIWNDTDGEVDVIVSGVGTGGTISGISHYIKQTRGKPITSVAVEPEASPIISQTLAGESLQPGPHKIQGIGAGFIPGTLDLSMIDRVSTVSDNDAIDTARRLAREEGILCGISSGAAASAALKLAHEPEMKDKTIVVILPDAGERYLSTFLFDGV